MTNTIKQKRCIDLKTGLTELLGIDYPILQGAMAWISESRLTAAVSNTGGAGIIGTAGRSEDWVRREIRQTKKLTQKPFGINITLEDSGKDLLVDVLCQEGAAFVTMGAGNPVPYIHKIQQAGIKVIPIVPNVRLAKRVEAAGADAIIIEGMESGGHIGTLTTMALLTNVIPEVRIPVISAGGIVNGRGMAAALLMGASGIQMGSRFLLTEECMVHPRVKERIIAAPDTDSVVTGSLSGHGGVRGLKNEFTERYLELEKNGTPQEELNEFAKGRNRLSAIDGDVENGSVQVGQSLTSLTKIQPVAQVLQEIVSEAVQFLSAAPNIIN